MIKSFLSNYPNETKYAPESNAGQNIPSQGCVVDDGRWFVLARENQRVCQRHATFGIRVNRLDRLAIKCRDDVLGLVGGRSGPVFRDCQPAINSGIHTHAGQCEKRADRDCAAAHIDVHVQH